MAASQGQEKPLFPRRGAPGPPLCPRLCRTPCRPVSPLEIAPCSDSPSEDRDKGPRTGPCAGPSAPASHQAERCPLCPPTQPTPTDYLQPPNQHRRRTQLPASSGSMRFLQDWTGSQRSLYPSPAWVSSTSRDVAPIAGTTACCHHGGLEEREETDTAPKPAVWCPPILAQAHITPRRPPPPAQRTPPRWSLLSPAATSTR